MPENNDDYPFENIPRKPLSIPIPRSHILHAVALQLEVDTKKKSGKRVLDLSALGNWTDEELGPAVPIILPGCKISVKDGFIFGKSPTTMSSFRLFSVSSSALNAFNLMNGINSLEEISQLLSQEKGWDIAHAFAYARGVFLALVAAGLSVPKE
jgi:hypothetical protein